MSRAKERLSELKDKGLITQEQYDELLAALGTVENEVPQVPQTPRLPVEPALPTGPHTASDSNVCAAGSGPPSERTPDL